jgi:hypothetical protein
LLAERASGATSARARVTIAVVAPGQVELARISDAGQIEVYFSPSEEELLSFSRLTPQEKAAAQTGIKLVRESPASLGKLQAMIASGRPLPMVVAGKLIAAWLVTGLPLIVLTPVLAVATSPASGSSA